MFQEVKDIAEESVNRQGKSHTWLSRPSVMISSFIQPLVETWPKIPMLNGQPISMTTEQTPSAQEALETTSKETLCWGFFCQTAEKIWNTLTEHACYCNMLGVCVFTLFGWRQIRNTLVYQVIGWILNVIVLVTLSWISNFWSLPGDSLPNDSICSACSGHTVLSVQHHNTTDCLLWRNVLSKRSWKHQNEYKRRPTTAVMDGSWRKRRAACCRVSASVFRYQCTRSPALAPRITVQRSVCVHVSVFSSIPGAQIIWCCGSQTWRSRHAFLFQRSRTQVSACERRGSGWRSVLMSVKIAVTVS